jgi:hypothetical protein
MMMFNPLSGLRAAVLGLMAGVIGLMAAVIGLMAVAVGAAVADPATSIAIENQTLKVNFDSSDGTFTVQSKATGRLFITAGKFEGKGGEGKARPVDDVNFGHGDELAITTAGGQQHHLALFGRLPFVVAHSTLHNGTDKPAVYRAISLLSAKVDAGRPASALRVMGTGGLTTVEQCPGSYAWLAIAEPMTRHGIVAGWITHNRASGVVFSKLEGDQVVVEARGDYGHLQIEAGKDAETESLAIGEFDDARLGLEAWADAVARVYHVKLKPQPLGYCTWYSDKHGGSSNEKFLAEVAEFAAKELKPFGFNFVQIDDGWQLGEKLNGPKKNFAAFNPKGAYGSGMRATADHLKSLGLTPGIWFMPFAGTFNDPAFAGHEDWFVKDANGKPFDTRWGGTCLDMTHPGAREYLRSIVKRIAGEWGYTYFKMDGMFTGTATRLTYVNSGYKEDNIGESILHDPGKTHIEAYRDGIKLVRETAGEGVFILACCAPQNMRSYAGAFGLVDAMRIGPDNNASWKGLMRGTLFGSRNYFLHGRIWYNDPDPLYAREKLPLAQAQLIASWVTVSGQLSASSDWLPDLPADRLNILRRTMPSHGLLPRPVDYFERDLPRLWLLSDARTNAPRDIVAIYNWEDKPLEVSESLEHLGLAPGGKYVGFDFWADKLLPPINGTLRSSVARQSCQIISMKAVSDHPQVISTSRHITQGMVDLLSENWDATAKALSGKSRVVAGDSYELRIVAPDGADWEVLDAKFGGSDQGRGEKISIRKEGRLTRVRIDPSTSGEVAWSVRFK